MAGNSRKVLIPRDAVEQEPPVEDFIDVEFRKTYTNEEGKTATYNVKVHNTVAGRIAKLVETDLFPYEDHGDFIRHAIERHVEWLERFSETKPKVAGKVLRSIDLRLATAEFVTQADRVFERAQEHIQNLFKLERFDMAVLELDAIRNMIGTLRGVQYTQFKHRFEKELVPLMIQAQDQLLEQATTIENFEPMTELPWKFEGELDECDYMEE